MGEDFCMEDTWNFPNVRMYELPPIDDDDDGDDDNARAMRNISTPIACKRKAIKYLTARIRIFKKTIKPFAQKRDRLVKEIMDSDSELEELNIEIENQYKRFRHMEGYNRVLESPNDLVELLDITERLCEDIDKWTRTAERLKISLHNWYLKKALLEYKIKEREEWIKFRQQLVDIVEEHICLLKLLIEAKEQEGGGRMIDQGIHKQATKRI